MWIFHESMFSEWCKISCHSKRNFVAVLPVHYLIPTNCKMFFFYLTAQRLNTVLMETVNLHTWLTHLRSKYMYSSVCNLTRQYLSGSSSCTLSTYMFCMYVFPERTHFVLTSPGQVLEGINHENNGIIEHDVMTFFLGIARLCDISYPR